MNDDIIGKLVTDFEMHASGSKSLESARDDMRRYLQHLSPQFVWGQFTSVATVLQYMLSTPSTTIRSTMKCKNDHTIENRVYNNTCCLFSASKSPPTDIATWMANLCDETDRTCSSCSEKLMMFHQFIYPLPLIALEFAGHSIQINYEFNISISNRDIPYKLVGIIYFENSHFTSRVIHDNMVWFHDGAVTEQTMVYEGLAYDLPLDSLKKCKGKDALVAIYVKC
jgi:hypothetical protein